MTKKQQKQVDKIVMVLMGQRFYDFYVSEDEDRLPLFDKYLNERFEKPELKKEVEEKIKELFDIK